ncbi:hypothetical protein AVEN_132250-1, partial [Araneus ventricosus]
SGKHPFSPFSDYLTDAWAPTVHKLCHKQAFCGLCDPLLIDSSTAISRVVTRRFCRMSSSTSEIVALLVTVCACPGRGKSLMLLVPPHNADNTGTWCTVQDTALRTLLLSCDKFVKHAPLLREEIG